MVSSGSGSIIVICVIASDFVFQKGINASWHRMLPSGIISALTKLSMKALFTFGAYEICR